MVKTSTTRSLPLRILNQVMNLGLPHGLLRPKLQECIGSCEEAYVFYVEEEGLVRSWGLLFEDIDKGWRLWLFTHPEYRNKGFAREIVEVAQVTKPGFQVARYANPEFWAKMGF